jgi:hypothetical protein
MELFLKVTEVAKPSSEISAPPVFVQPAAMEPLVVATTSGPTCVKVIVTAAFATEPEMK